MRKPTILAWILCAAMFAMGGCNSAQDKEPQKEIENKHPESMQNAAEEASTAEDESEQKLASFSASALDGSKYSEEIFSGKDLTAINFWALFCNPCISEMPDLADFEKNLPEHVQMITVCMDGYGAEEKVKDVLEKAEYEGITLLTADGDLADYCRTVQYLPTTIFVDEEGTVVGDMVIGSQVDFQEYFKGKMNELLKEMGKDTIK